MLCDDFFKMELECELFNLKDDRVDQFWDVVRREVYMEYYHRGHAAGNSHKNEVKSYRLVRLISAIFQDLSYYISKLGVRSLVISNTRYVDAMGLQFDKASDNIISALGSDAFIMNQRTQGIKYKYRFTSGILLGYFINKYKRYSANECNKNRIHESLIKYLGEDLLPKGLIDNAYRGFLAKRAYFDFLFTVKRFKTVYFVQNGNLKGMVAAAKKHHIKTIEIQHGSFEVSHPAYSYPSGISYSDSRILMPDYMATFGPYWGHNFNLPVNEILPIGNDFYYQTPKRAVPENHIVIVSSSVHANYLIPFTLQLASKYKDIKIYYKLHSGEGIDNAAFKDCNNVIVISEEYNATELIYKAALVIAINSTVLYEALNFNRKIAIVKVLDYEGQRSLFNLPNVFLIDTIDDIKDALAAQTTEDSPEFFTSFNEELFKDV